MAIEGDRKLLLTEIAEKAQLRGVESFSGQVLGENRRVLGLLNAAFAGVAYVMSHRLYNFHVPLQTLKPTVQDLLGD